jgi:hypothetical protein
VPSAEYSRWRRLRGSGGRSLLERPLEEREPPTQAPSHSSASAYVQNQCFPTSWATGPHGGRGPRTLRTGPLRQGVEVGVGCAGNPEAPAISGGHSRISIWRWPQQPGSSSGSGRNGRAKGREEERARVSVVGENVLWAGKRSRSRYRKPLTRAAGRYLNAIAGRDQLWGVWEACAPAQRRGQK